MSRAILLWLPFSSSVPCGGDRVALGDNGGHAERDNRDGKHNAFIM